MFSVRKDQALMLTPDLMAREVWEASKSGKSEHRWSEKTKRFSPVDELVVGLYSTARNAEAS
jgi:hypothetical protein